MSSYTFRPAIREQTPLIIGLAGPTKSGKTMSALRLATGMARGGTIAMINAEGLRGHQYADRFKYMTCDIEAPFRPMVYTDALKAAAQLNPAVVIIDSASHMHDGPGGILEWHEEIMDKIGQGDKAKRDRATYTAWVQPKQAENQFIYQMLSMKCPVILSLRAKEKIKIITGKPPIDLGWQPIVGERIAFETIFTLTLTPHCKGVPDLSISDMREPFDTMIPKDRPLDENVGAELAQWAAGGQAQPNINAGKMYMSPLVEADATPPFQGVTSKTPPFTIPPPDVEIVYNDHRKEILEAENVAKLETAFDLAINDAAMLPAHKENFWQLRREQVKELGKKK